MGTQYRATRLFASKTCYSYQKRKRFYQYGCLQPLNNAATEFNEQLRTLCEELRSEMKNVTIVYADIYSINYDLIAHATNYGTQYLRFYFMF